MSSDSRVGRHPGPAFLDGLEQCFRRLSPKVLEDGAEAIEFAADRLSLTDDEQAIFRRGLLAYYLLFVEPALELDGAPLVPSQQAARLQLLALIHWRSIDALLDADTLQLSAHRHRELATLASCHIRDTALKLGLDWDGHAGREYLAFHIPSPGLDIGDIPPGHAILDAFLEEQFVIEPETRMSFLHFMPRYVWRAPIDDRCWYGFYTAVISLDDDLDDVLADVLAERSTPAVRLLRRMGAFRDGQATSFGRYLRFAQSFLLRQLDICLGLARRDGRASAAIVLSILREAVQHKFT